jgi:hypothetical protein
MNAFLTPAEGNKASPFIESAIPNETEWYGETIGGLRWSIYQGDAEKELGSQEKLSSPHIQVQLSFVDTGRLLLTIYTLPIREYVRTPSVT